MNMKFAITIGETTKEFDLDVELLKNDGTVQGMKVTREYMSNRLLHNFSETLETEWNRISPLMNDLFDALGMAD
jgi:hypothetical protein